MFGWGLEYSRAALCPMLSLKDKSNNIGWDSDIVIQRDKARNYDWDKTIKTEIDTNIERESKEERYNYKKEPKNHQRVRMNRRKEKRDIKRQRRGK